MIKIKNTYEEAVEIDAEPGDAFGVQSKGIIGFLIRLFTRIWSYDDNVKYNHLGLLIDNEQTFEGLYSGFKVSNLSRYAGKKIIIARFDSISAVKREEVLKVVVTKFAGRMYPYWRLLLHIIWPFSKFAFLGIPVCSELVAYYENALELRHKQWAGTSPDKLVDEWRKWRGITVLGEGILLEEDSEESDHVHS